MIGLQAGGVAWRKIASPAIRKELKAMAETQGITVERLIREAISEYLRTAKKNKLAS